MTKLTRTPEGDWVEDDDHLVEFSGNNQFGDHLQSYLAGGQAPVLSCEICGAKNDVEPWSVSRHKVPDSSTVRTLCYIHADELRSEHKRKKVAEESKALLANVEGWVQRQMIHSGMRPLELAASIDKMSSQISNALSSQAPEFMEELMAGDYPRKGRGLTGVARIGKTLALAATMKVSFKNYLIREAPRLGNYVERDGFAFAFWPSVCAKLRLEGGNSDLSEKARVMHRLSKKDLVFLDDLGREGISSGRTYNDDPCLLLLNEIINERHAHGRPLIWTSNLAPDKLSTFYGPAFYERLVDLAPPIVIEGATPITGGPHPLVG